MVERWVVDPLMLVQFQPQGPIRECRLVVRHRLPTPRIMVRFLALLPSSPGATEARRIPNPKDVGSIPTGNANYVREAQMDERWTTNPVVAGSTPVTDAISCPCRLMVSRRSLTAKTGVRYPARVPRLFRSTAGLRPLTPTIAGSTPRRATNASQANLVKAPG